MSREQFTCIANPVSGKGKALTEGTALQEQLQKQNHQCHLLISEYKGHIALLVNKALENNCTQFIIAGGDGTLNECINAFCSSPHFAPGKIAFTVLPFGTGNDFAHHLQLRNTALSAANRMLQKKIMVHDVGYIEKTEAPQHRKYFINMAGFAFDALVAKTANHIKQKNFRGKWIYYVALLRHLFVYRSIPCSLNIASQNTLRIPLFTGAIGIGKSNGGGMLQCPLAIPNDGLFDITLIEKMNLGAIVLSFPKLFNGKIYEHKKVHHYKCSSLELKSESNMLIECDGEDAMQLPCRVQIIPQAFRVYID